MRPLLRAIPIGLNSPIAVYAKLVGKELRLDDIREDEPATHHYLSQILGYTAEELEAAELELPINGQDILLTPANRADLVNRRVNSLIGPRVDAAFGFIRQALNEVIPANVFDGLTTQQFRELIVGDSSFDVDDVSRNVTFAGYGAQSPQIIWLLTFLRGATAEQRRQFLRLTTASGQLPAGGFSRLTQPILIQRHGAIHLLPTAATCFHTFKLPPYPSEAILRQKVSLAIRLDGGMGNV